MQKIKTSQKQKKETTNEKIIEDNINNNCFINIHDALCIQCRRVQLVLQKSKKSHAPDSRRIHEFYIAKILDVLKTHNATGAFFVLENIIKHDTELVRRMANEGHLICNHTAKHKDMTKMNDEQFAAELKKLEDVLMEYVGVECAKFYRPPEGRFNEKNLKAENALGYKTVFWSLAYADWDNDKQPEKEKAKQLLLSNTHNGAVILLHPTSKTNADILDSLLTEWEKEGYRFGTLSELF